MKKTGIIAGGVAAGGVALAGVDPQMQLIHGIVTMAAKQGSAAFASWASLAAVCLMLWQIKSIKSGIAQNTTRIQDIVAVLKEMRLPKSAKVLLDRVS